MILPSLVDHPGRNRRIIRTRENVVLVGTDQSSGGGPGSRAFHRGRVAAAAATGVVMRMSIP